MAPQVGGPAASSAPPPAGGFRAVLHGAQPSASLRPTPAPADLHAHTAHSAIAKPLFALAMDILWKRNLKSSRSMASGAHPRFFDGGEGVHASAMEGRKSALAIYLGLPGELAAFFRGRGKDGGRKKKRRQGKRQRPGSNKSK